MKNMPENELFSAYLDGELTAEEQAAVERLLAASPAARQLVDELRTLSSSLQALPAHKVGEDLSGQVLRRAERQMLSGPDPAPPGPAESSQPEGPAWRAILRRVVRPRTLVWSGVAVAVAVLLMMMEPDRILGPRDRPVAVRIPARGEESEVAFRAAPVIESGPAVDAEMLAEKEKAASPELSDADLLADQPDRKIGQAGAPEPRAPAVSRAPSTATPPAPTFARAEPGTRESPQALTTGKAGPTGYGGYSFGAGGARASRPEKADAESARRQRQLGGQGGIAAGRVEPAAPAAPDSAPGTTPGQPLGEAQEPETSLVVWGDVTSGAVHEQVFEGLLEKQQITRAKGVETGGGRLATADASAQAGKLESTATKPSDVIDVVHDVEATPDQIRALLADVVKRPEQFALLSSEWAPGVVSYEFQAAQAARRVHVRESRALWMHQALPPIAETTGELGRGNRGRIAIDQVLGALELRERKDEVPGQTQAGRAEVAAEGQPADMPSAPAPGQQARPVPRESVAGEEPAAVPLKPGEPETVKVPVKPSEAEETAVEQRLTSNKAEQTPVGPPRRHGEKPKEGKQAEQPLQTEELDRDVRKYRVLFVFHVVNRADVAASLAEETRPAEVAGQAAPAAIQAAEMPSAEATQAAKPEP